MPTAPGKWGNVRRPSDVPVKYDAELLARAQADKKMFIQGAFKIINGDTQQIVPFVFRSEQKKYWENRTLCDIILKPRKRGFSALIDAEFLAACILDRNINAVVVSHRDEDAKVLFARVRWMLDNLDIKVNVSEEAVGHLKFSDTNSNFRSVAAGATEPRRGSDITHIHLSERAFYPSESFLTALDGACVKDARRVIETTANGFGTPFHKFWLKTKRGETAYKDHFFAWWEADDYEVDVDAPLILDDTEKRLREAYGLSDRKLAWRRGKLREMNNPDLFDQEYPHSSESAFLTSSRMVFDWLAIQKQSQAIEPPKWIGRLRNLGQRIEIAPADSGPLKVWDTPREDRRYVISADVAEGIAGGNYSVADVLDISTWEQVAQWRGHITPYDFADVLGDLGAYYNWGVVVPEVNNHGLSTCSRLADNGYPNLYVREQKKEGVIYGWQTMRKNKIEMVNGLAHSLRDLEIKVNSQDTLDELKSFVYLDTRNDTGAQAGTHDDCVMSLAIGVSVLCETRETPQTTRQKFREAMGVRREVVLPRSNQGYGVRTV